MIRMTTLKCLGPAPMAQGVRCSFGKAIRHSVTMLSQILLVSKITTTSCKQTHHFYGFRREFRASYLYMCVS